MIYPSMSGAGVATVGSKVGMTAAARWSGSQSKRLLSAEVDEKAASRLLAAG